MTKKELRELREDVENPRYDKRRKFGEDSFPVFKAGTRFLLTYHLDGKCTGLPKTAQLVDRDIDNNEIIVTGGTLVKLFYASSRVVEPTTINDLVAIYDVSRTAILDELLKAGLVSIEGVDQVCGVIRERQQKAKVKAVKPAETSTDTTPPIVGVTSETSEVK